MSTVTAPTGEVPRIPAGAPRRIVKLAEAVDHAEADLDAAYNKPLAPVVQSQAHEDYVDACETLLEAVTDEATGIEDVLTHGYRLTQHPLPAGAQRVADALRAYADDLEDRRGM